MNDHRVLYDEQEATISDAVVYQERKTITTESSGGWETKGAVFVQIIRLPFVGPWDKYVLRYAAFADDHRVGSSYWGLGDGYDGVWQVLSDISTDAEAQRYGIQLFDQLVEGVTRLQPRVCNDTHESHDVDGHVFEVGNVALTMPPAAFKALRRLERKAMAHHEASINASFPATSIEERDKQKMCLEDIGNIVAAILRGESVAWVRQDE